ncbi:major facilitator superfamily domain-containing protein [Lentinula aciculospora]|uniref:Major facilitator superfamily domain-containing protein n=1 Tax=Lentinula aciculospora TaxID=153920 RepID=A0A9W8ZV30_9AGAR|nr:major facilitator superfamily domain-containing protein [Lentinula aciculospora]
MLNAVHEETAPLLHVESNFDPLFGDIEERKEVERSLLRKLDGRMFLLGVIYILNYIDRQNIAVARLRGFEEDLKLEGSQYASCLGIVYVGYLLTQVPSNMFLEHIGKPSIYLSSCMILWGFVSMLTGAARGFYDALVARFCLGFVEAAFFPGALLLISKWYKRDEIGQRTAYLANGLLIANATGSLLASGILEVMDNVYGIAAWRWLFFVEGALTISVAICAMYILPDFPKTSSSWLSSAEQALAVRRIQEEYAMDDSPEHPFKGLLLAISDRKVWSLAIILGLHAFSSSFHIYFPTLVQTIGYSPIITLLICIPPWLTAIVVVILISRHSDKTSERCWHITLSMGVAVIGYVIAMSTMNPVVRYISFFFMTQMHAGYVCFMAWASTSVSEPPSKRASALALINTGGILASIFVPYAWPSSWGPDYSKSFGICIFANILTVTACWVFRGHLASLNNLAKPTMSLIGRQQGKYQYQL